MENNTIFQHCCICLNLTAESRHLNKAELFNALSNLSITYRHEWNDAPICSNCSCKVLESVQFITAVKISLDSWAQQSMKLTEETSEIAIAPQNNQPQETQNVIKLLPKTAEKPSVTPSGIIVKKPRRYECTDCAEVFNAFRQLRKHMEKHTSKSANIVAICELCCAAYANVQVLRQHTIERHSGGLHHCILCERNYRSKGRLRQHYMNIHKKNGLPYYCIACRTLNHNCEFNVRADLQEHVLSMHPTDNIDIVNQPIDEDNQLEMNEEFLDEFLLASNADGSFQFSEECWEALDLHLSDELLNQTQQTHQNLENNEVLYACPRCSEGCANQKALLLHLASHHGLSVLNCNTCEASFSDIDTLIHHKTTHNIQKRSATNNNQCGICDRIFRSHAALVYHVKTHSRTSITASHTCPFCTKAFHTDVNLKQHLRIVHSEVRRHICQLCDARFTTLDHLKKHVLSRHHNERRFACEHCDKRFIQSSHLKQHELMHRTIRNISCA